MSWLQRKILSTQLGRSAARYAGRITLPGFDKLRLLEVLRFFIVGLQQGSINARAATMSWHFFMAIFPTLIFLITLIPFIPIRNFQVVLFEMIRGIIPNSTFNVVQGILTDIIASHHGKLLSIGFIATLYFGTNGFNAMFHAFNKSIHVKETRKPWKQRLIAIALGLVLTVLLVVCIALMIGSEYLIKELIHEGPFLPVLLVIGRILFLGLLTIVAISLFYHYGPAKPVHWRFLSPGAVLATILILLSWEGFALYINNFDSYNKLYGSLGTIIVLQLWIYINSLMLLIGFELNAGIDAARKNRASLKMPKEE